MSHLLSTENYDKISEFIYRKSGIFFQDENNYKKIAHHIDSRCKFLDYDSFKKYYFKIRFDDADGYEFQELMNAVTVNETYFCREKEQFEVLVDEILPELHEKISPHRPLRILSAPCSSGEEPYSIMLKLIQNGDILKKRAIEVVGIDIDSSSIKKAKTAIFSDYSTSHISKDMRSKWFVKKLEGYQLSKEVQDSVKFYVVNVLDKQKMMELGKFDVIFSRNMLMYFDDESRKEVAMTYYDMLNPNSYIFLGNSEDMQRIVSVFSKKKMGDILVYHK